MKRTSRQWLRTCLAILAVGIIASSCTKDEPVYQVNAFEMELHQNVNKFRQSQGLGDLVFFQDLFVEARQQSAAWLGSGNFDEGLEERRQKIAEHWDLVNGPDALLATINSTDTAAARMVVEGWIQDSLSRSILADDHVQSGPGIAEGEDGTVYITHFFMKIQD